MTNGESVKLPRAATDLWRLELARDDCESATVLVARGRVGVVSAAALRVACATALSGGRHSLVLDLCGVDYISSAGLAVMREAAGLAANAGQMMIICGLTEPVQLVLDLAGVAPSVEVAPDRSAALARLHERAVTNDQQTGP